MRNWMRMTESVIILIFFMFITNVIIDDMIVVVSIHIIAMNISKIMVFINGIISKNNEDIGSTHFINNEIITAIIIIIILTVILEIRF